MALERTSRIARFRILAPALCATLLTSCPALAHSGGDIAGGFLSGVMHPLSGPDHLVAMVAVGLWGAVLGAPAIWLLPVVFPLVMAVGAVAAIVGLPLPATEWGIAISALVLGVVVALGLRAPLIVAAIIVGCFAIFHGYAHGAELPDGGNALAYSTGFVIATGLLHLAGIALGQLTRWSAGMIAVRVAGAGIAVAGLFFLGKLA